MCGIGGILLKPNITMADLPARLQWMAQAMTHRGPDDEGIYVAPHQQVGLANRRLAIRDLSPAGHMPMGNQAGTIWITYNGEIYNADALRRELEHQGCRFRSTSDTEVILQGYEVWGQGVVKRLRGMFAFAIVDLRPGYCQLYLARDHMGIKPLYYAWSAAGLLFGSELKTILASGLVSREISPAGLVGYLLMGSVPNPWTIYRDIRGLPPASTLTVSLHQPTSVAPEIYWQLPIDTVEPPSYTAAVEEVRTLLTEAVRSQLVSDVPLGAFLSGGLDSSSVVALMRQATTGPIRTCSMVFAEAEYSEARYARAMAEHVGAEHYERVITADDLLREFDNILATMDQPTVDGVNTYFVSQTARQAGLTVALSGLGADEIFGGYPNTFQQAPRIERLLRWGQAIPGGKLLARNTLGLLPNANRWRRVVDALHQPASPASAYLTRRGLFAPSEVRALVTPEIWQEASQEFDAIAHITGCADGQSKIENQKSKIDMAWLSRAELRTYMHHQLLRDTDVMSMAHSLEVRVPLIDVRLVERVLRLPTATKTRQAITPKPLLVQAMDGQLPDIVSQRRDKQGFTFPFAHWLHIGKLPVRRRELLGQIGQQGWLREPALRQIENSYLAKGMHWSRLWALLALATLPARQTTTAKQKVFS